MRTFCSIPDAGMLPDSVRRCLILDYMETGMEMKRLCDAVCNDGRIARVTFSGVCGILGLDRAAMDDMLMRELGTDGDGLLWYWRE